MPKKILRVRILKRSEQIEYTMDIIILIHLFLGV